MRALLLTSGVGLIGGCGVRTELLEPWQEATTPMDDAGFDTRPPLDAPGAPEDADETDVPEPPTLGTCTFEDQSLLCLPGDVCYANFVVGPSPFICGLSGDPSTPCGLIGCGAGCVCADASISTCRCE